MKHWPRAWKAQLIVNTNPGWAGLFETLNQKGADRGGGHRMPRRLLRCDPSSDLGQNPEAYPNPLKTLSRETENPQLCPLSH
jgi:hypothetical protein